MITTMTCEMQSNIIIIIIIIIIEKDYAQIIQLE
jgi:hypothetical protein